jgi:hypothetical protein
MPVLLEIGQTHYLLAAMLVLLLLLLVVILFMLLYLLATKKHARRNVIWKQTADRLIWAAIFPGETGQPPIGKQLQRWMKHPAFRQCFIDEMVTAKKNLSGDAATHILSLYATHRLDADSEHKLSSLKWHIRARGIQELALMERKDRVSKIYRYINNRNEFVRMEAQSAIVQLYGWDGLRFLDVVSEPISEWQQMKLLSLLPRTSGEPVSGIGGWLRSANPSVVLFSLKLAGLHHRFDLHDEVVACLDHAEPGIATRAVRCLQEIYNESTAGLLAATYQKHDNAYKEAVLEALGIIGAVDSRPFLEAELLDGSNTVKLLAARALAAQGQRGADCLDACQKANESPWLEIIRQAKSEMIT